MTQLILLLHLICISLESTINKLDFRNPPSDMEVYIVDDGVMGGMSSGHIDISDEGYAYFHGYVSLENNGGFSSVRFIDHSLTPAKNASVFRLKIRGDGKHYQFRVKYDINDRVSYVYNFKTTGKDQIVEVPFNDLRPSFRGRALDMPEYDGHALEEIGLLIGNKKNEEFGLRIYSIELKP